MKKKAIKLIRIFEDGSEEYIDGDDLVNFSKFERKAYTLAMLRGLKQGEVKWKKEKGSLDKYIK